jgi:hypothetical protein
MPIVHVVPEGHALPHAPQFIALVWRLTHVADAPLGVQSTSPAGHIRAAIQVPETQRWFAIHALPQDPQLLTSLCGLMQPPPQAISGAVHITAGAHVPARQTSPAAHARSHMPQLSGLLCVSTHAPPQIISPAMHMGPVPVSCMTPVS